MGARSFNDAIQTFAPSRAITIPLGRAWPITRHKKDMDITNFITLAFLLSLMWVLALGRLAIKRAAVHDR